MHLSFLLITILCAKIELVNLEQFQDILAVTLVLLKTIHLDSYLFCLKQFLEAIFFICNCRDVHTFI